MTAGDESASSRPAGRAGGSWRGRAVGLAAFAVLCVHFWVGAELTSALTDDAFISYRYAENLVEGRGLVFNEGERVEGYTDFLWVVILAAGHAAGFALTEFSRGVSVLCAAGLVLAMAGFSRRYFRDEPFPAVSYLAPALLAVSPMFVRHVGIGLEAVFFALLLFLALSLRLTRERDGGSLVPVGVLFGLAQLTRPDAVVWLAALGAVDVAYAVAAGRAGRAARLARIARYGAVFAAIVAVHLLWRFGYYGEWVPNTYHMRSIGNWAWGAKSILRFFVYSTGFLAVAALLSPAVLRARWAVTFVAVGAVYVVFVIRNGGAGGRYAVPLAPLVFVLVQELVRRALVASAAAGARPAWRGRTALIALLLLVASLVGAARYEWHVAKRNLWFSEVANRNAEKFGRCLRAATAPGDWIASATAGALPYYSRRPVIDMLGLNDRHIARYGQLNPDSLPGHQHADSEYVLGRRPRVIFMDDSGSAVGSVYAIDEMLANPRLRDLYELTEFRCGRDSVRIFVDRERPFGPESGRGGPP